MLPIQSSLDGSPPRPSGGTGGPPAASEAGEGRHQKPKTLPCKYCSKRFRSVRLVRLPNMNLLPPHLSPAFLLSCLTRPLDARAGESSMSRGTRGRTPRRSPSSASGIAAGRPLDVGEFAVFRHFHLAATAQELPPFHRSPIWCSQYPSSFPRHTALLPCTTTPYATPPVASPSYACCSALPDLTVTLSLSHLHSLPLPSSPLSALVRQSMLTWTSVIYS